MHELSLASSVLEAVAKELRSRPGCHATRICLRIGDYAGVDADSLQFCFDALVKDTLLEPLECLIDRAAGDELDIAWIELEEPLTGTKEEAA